MIACNYSSLAFRRPLREYFVFRFKPNKLFWGLLENNAGSDNTNLINQVLFKWRGREKKQNKQFSLDALTLQARGYWTRVNLSGKKCFGLENLKIHHELSIPTFAKFFGSPQSCSIVWKSKNNYQLSQQISHPLGPPHVKRCWIPFNMLWWRCEIGSMGYLFNYNNNMYIRNFPKR